jgi:hypothetical protein
MPIAAEIPHYRILQAIAVLKGEAVAAYPNCPGEWTLEPQSLPREYQHRETIVALKGLADHPELKPQTANSIKTKNRLSPGAD